MKRYGGLWERVIAWENLRLAARKARRGKRDRACVQHFEFDLEKNLLALRLELAEGTYRPGPFSTHWINRPKARLISAAPYRKMQGGHYSFCSRGIPARASDAVERTGYLQAAGSGVNPCLGTERAATLYAGTQGG